MGGRKVNSKLLRGIIAFTPFFLTLVIVIAINFRPVWEKSGEQNSNKQQQLPKPTFTPAAHENAQALSISTEGEEPLSQETIVLQTTTVVPTNMPQPTIPPDAFIQLVGPPAESEFFDENNVSFYWYWPLPLTENQQFTLLLVNEVQDQQRIATINSTNLGQSYFINLEVPVVSDEFSPVFWQIQLEQISTEEILVQSPLRSISFITN